MVSDTIVRLQLTLSKDTDDITTHIRTFQITNVFGILPRFIHTRTIEKTIDDGCLQIYINRKRMFVSIDYGYDSSMNYILPRELLDTVLIRCEQITDSWKFEKELDMYKRLSE